MAIEPVPFGKYELVSRLAAGGMAEIFLARTKSLHGFEKYLVVKKILKDRTQDPEFVRMLLDEARIAATLDHPNIVQIYDLGSIDGEFFIAMEYLRGHNVIELVRAGAKVGYSKPPLEHVISTLTGVCAGLHYAHEKRGFDGKPLEIVHRDVTPQNIVITFEGAVKLVDFGIAKATTREVETMAGTLKGKMGYMSPEQCRGLAVDRRSDLFALGIILYELTTGKRLYHERSDFDTLKKIIEGPVPAPRDLLPFYPAFLNAIVVRCLQKNPEERYQTARDLHADLDAFARDNQLVTGTVPLGQFMERVYAAELADHHQAADSAAHVVGSQMALTHGASAAYLGESSRRSSQLRAPLLEARRRHLARRLRQVVVALALLGAGGGGVLWYTRLQRPGSGSPAPVRQAAVATPLTTPLGTAPVTTVLPPPAAPAPARPPAPAHAHVHAGDAHITVAADPRCEVLVDGMPYGSTPLVDLTVPAGRHLVTLLNANAGIKEVRHITLGGGQLWTRAFVLTNGKLDERTAVSPHLLAASIPQARPSVPPGEPRQDAPVTPAVALERPAGGAAAASPIVDTDAPAPGQPHRVASFVLDAQRVSAPEPHLPRYLVEQNAGRRLSGTYRICVDRSGHVYQVTPVGTIAGADDTVMATLRTWTYRPQAHRICALKRVTFEIP